MDSGESVARRSHVTMSIRVLLVEDDAATRRLIASMLAKIGAIEVEQVEDGTAAVDRLLFDREPFDLALIDWDIPGKDGLTVFRTIRASGNQTPVFMVTSESRETHVRRAIEAGVSDYFVKPVCPERFLRRMADLRTEAEIRKLGSQYRVRHVMNREPATIGPQATAAEAMRRITEGQLGGLSVVDPQNRLLGDISEYQLVRVICAPELSERQVESLMSRDLHVVNPSTLLSCAASLILQHNVRRIPVVEDGVLVGLVARGDLLRYALDNRQRLEELALAVRSFLSVKAVQDLCPEDRAAPGDSGTPAPPESPAAAGEQT